LGTTAIRIFAEPEPEPVAEPVFSPPPPAGGVSFLHPAPARRRSTVAPAMKLDRMLIRRALLFGSGVVFAVIGLAAIFAPHFVAAQYGFSSVEGTDAMNEFRAVFTGFWWGLALLLITAAKKPEAVLLGDLAGAMIGLQALARALSFALDGMPSAKVTGAFAGELLTAIVILAVRPSPRSGGDRDRSS
jgi:hypothetical protein